MSLTDKRRAFVREYLIDFNGTQAAIRAGYSKNSARQQAEQILRLEYIQEEITKGKKRLEEKATLSKLDILGKLEDIMNDVNLARTNTGNKIKAIEVYNKMLGYNEPDKVDVEISTSVP